MAIDLLHLFSQNRPNAAAGEKSEAVSTAEQNYQILKAVRSLQAGQTLRGEILSVQGEEVQLAIMKDTVISAKLDQSLNLSAGTMMTFQVKSNNSKGIAIRPLFTNTAVDPNVTKALSLAGLPEQPRSIEMVQTLMERGLPIDKNSLQSLYRELSLFQEASVGDMISLHQMEIPVTEENLQQFALYENNNHFLGDTFTEIGQQIGNQIEQWISQGDLESLTGFVTELQSLFTENTVQEGILPGEALTAGEEGSTVLEGALQNGEKSGGSLSEITTSGEKVLISEEALFAKGQTGESSLEKAEVLKSGKQSEAEVSSETGKESAAKKGLEKASMEAPSWEKLLELITKEKHPAKAASMFKELWNRETKNQWLLEPEAVAEKEKVEKFYEKLQQQTGRLEEMVNQYAGKESAIGKAVQNTNANLEFMNQMNQMYAYVQLPLKLSEGKTNGELYVYTNKKNLAKKEEKVTALLHLSMEHLGDMDIFVALEQSKVNTKFYLEKEEFLDFLEERMPLLTERLNKRGYECDIQASVREEKTEASMLHKILDNKNKNVLLSAKGFDVRA